MARKEIETCFNYCELDDDSNYKGFFSSNEQRWITKIRRLAEQYPDKCTILQQPEVNGGHIYAKMPTSWLKVSPPRKVEMTDEQRKAIAERLASSRNK